MAFPLWMLKYFMNAVELDLAQGDGSLHERVRDAWYRLGTVAWSPELPAQLRPEIGRLVALWEAEDPVDQAGKAVARLTEKECRDEARAIVAMWHLYQELAAQADADAP